MEDGVTTADVEDVADAAPQPIPVETLIRMFEASEESTVDERQGSERDRDYYDNIQLTAEEEAVLKKRKQPIVIDNKIKGKVDYLVGHEIRTRTDPKAFPRTPKEEDAANAATDALRFVADSTRFSQAKTKVWENVLIEGMGGVLIGCKHKKDGKVDITIKQIPWDRLFRDPHSRERDFSDATYKGIVTWMDYDVAVKKWPDATDALEVTLSQSNSQTYDDRPKHRIWADGKRKRVRVCEIYYRHDGVWFQAFYTEGGLLSGNEPVKYVDQDKEPECPLELLGGYCNRENERYGIVRPLISLQDEQNKRRSKALHLLSVRQVIAEKGAVANVATARAELAKPDGYVEVTPNMRFDIAQTNDLAQGQFQLLAQTDQALSQQGANAALLGKDQNAPSGRAILANQQGGQTELAPLLDGLRDWQRRVMTQVWNRIRQYWTAETWIRVTDDENNLKWVGLNVPQVAQTAYGPQQVGVENPVADLMVDITIEEAPDTANIQAEQFEQLTQMVTAGIQIPPDVVIEASSLRNKAAILDRMRGDPQAQAQQQAEQKQKADAVFAAKLDIDKSTAEKNRASAIKSISDAATQHHQATLPPPEISPPETSGVNVPPT